jgi:hypothetical protein
MPRDVVARRPEHNLKEIWAMMCHGSQRGLVVDRSRKPLGVLYARDAVQSLLGKFEHEKALLRD